MPVSLEDTPYSGRDRQYVSQFSQDVLILGIHKAGILDDPDNNEVIVTLRNESTDDLVVNHLPATRESKGLYNYQLNSTETAQPGYYTVGWSFALADKAQYTETYIEIGSVAPEYDMLVPGMKAIVDSVWHRFADTYDSPESGPNLMTYFQTYFGRARLSQLLKIAIGRLNTMAQPYMTYTLEQGGKLFPLDQWGPLLETALYIETLKHLIRSYVEQPLFVGGQITRLDRRDYMERWQSVLQSEEDMFQNQLSVFKIAHMGLGRPRVLASGGVYGRYGPTRIVGSVAARPRYWARWY